MLFVGIKESKGFSCGLNEVMRTGIEYQCNMCQSEPPLRNETQAMCMCKEGYCRAMMWGSRPVKFLKIICVKRNVIKIDCGTEEEFKKWPDMIIHDEFPAMDESASEDQGWPA